MRRPIETSRQPAMTELKTTINQNDVAAFIAGIEDAEKRRDCEEVMRLMQDITGAPPAMWGSSMVGFDSYHYVYDSGREGDWFQCGFAPRKQALTLYIMAGFSRYEQLMQKLGKYKTGKSCLYIKSLDDVDREVLAQLIRESVAYIRDKYPD